MVLRRRDATLSGEKIFKGKKKKKKLSGKKFSIGLPDKKFKSF